MIRKGAALDGKLVVTMDGSRVQHVHLDPRALRSGADDLAGAFAEAMNQALSTDRSDVLATLRALTADVQERRADADRRLAEVREDASRSNERTMAAREEAVEHGRRIAEWMSRS